MGHASLQLSWLSSSRCWDASLLGCKSVEHKDKGRWRPIINCTLAKRNVDYNGMLAKRKMGSNGRLAKRKMGSNGRLAKRKMD